MLRTLGIRDFVIVERLDLEFQGGFTSPEVIFQFK